MGFIPAVSQDFSAERAALDQTIRSPVVGAMAAEDLTVTNVAASPPAQAVSFIDMTISKARSVPFGLTAVEQKLPDGSTMDEINTNRVVQALRALTNEIEIDCYNEMHQKVSRGFGTSGTTPFGTANDFSDAAGALEILDENGAPDDDRHLVLGSAGIRNLRGRQAVLFKVNESGTDDLLRRGVLGQLEGFDVHQSAAIRNAVTAGTAAAATTNTAGYAIGATTITLAVAGTGTFVAGDLVAFAGDSRKYLVTTGDTDVSNGGSIVIAEPGLLRAIPAAATAITLSAAATRNLFFHRSAIQLATRAPEMPEGGDAADDVQVIMDPVSKIAYEFCIYRQKRQVRYEVNLSWGMKLIAPRHAGILLG